VVVGRVSGPENRWGFEGEVKSELADVGKDRASVRTGGWHFEAQGKRFEAQRKQTRERIACRY
jgi:hypothetical protein